jgi:hypothetical protein
MVNGSGNGTLECRHVLDQENAGLRTAGRVKNRELSYPLHFQRIYASNRLILKNKSDNKTVSKVCQ